MWARPNLHNHNLDSCPTPQVTCTNWGSLNTRTCNTCNCPLGYASTTCNSKANMKIIDNLVTFLFSQMTGVNNWLPQLRGRVWQSPSPERHQFLILNHIPRRHIGLWYVNQARHFTACKLDFSFRSLQGIPMCNSNMSASQALKRNSHQAAEISDSNWNTYRISNSQILGKWSWHEYCQI